MVRNAAIVLVIGASLMAGPAAAQFGNIFGNPAPPRPPADVPNGFPAQPPPVGYPNQPAPAPPPAAAPPPSGIQAQPLPPPPGATAAPPPPQRARVTPPAANSPPPAQPANAPAVPPANPPPPQPADTSVQPDDTVVTETPTQKIVNDRAVFSGLDKITGRIISFDAAINETVQFGALQVTARACYTRPPTEATNTDAFVEVDEVTLKGEIKRIFTGWMFALSPGLHAVEHPIYDVWLTDCAQPEIAQAPASPAPPAAGQAPPPKQARQPATAAQAPRRPAIPAIAPSAPAPVTND
jgi:hypothetical protein